VHGSHCSCRCVLSMTVCLFVTDYCFCFFRLVTSLHSVICLHTSSLTIISGLCVGKLMLKFVATHSFSL